MMNAKKNSPDMAKFVRFIAIRKVQCPFV